MARNASRLVSLLLCCVFFLAGLSAQVPTYPDQPKKGPGGADYPHGDVLFQDFAEEPDGYWLFEPMNPRPAEAPVVVFVHGYSAFNPMVYGAWIRHLVQRGNIVIFPRYQRNIFSPGPDEFIPNVVKAIQDAYTELESGEHVRPSDQPLTMVGHSFGGAIIANIAARPKAYDIPRPEALMLVSPGVGPWKKFPLDSFENIPADTKLVCMVSEGDRIVGDELALRVFETAVNTPQRTLLRQFADEYGEPAIDHGHNESYAVDEAFDSGVHGYSYLKAKRSTLDPVDYLGYWRIFDALQACAFDGKWCNMALGGSHEQRHMGFWTDGTPIRELEVSLPDDKGILTRKD